MVLLIGQDPGQVLAECFFEYQLVIAIAVLQQASGTFLCIKIALLLPSPKWYCAGDRIQRSPKLDIRILWLLGDSTNASSHWSCQPIALITWRLHKCFQVIDVVNQLHVNIFGCSFPALSSYAMTAGTPPARKNSSPRNSPASCIFRDVESKLIPVFNSDIYAYMP